MYKVTAYRCHCKHAALLIYQHSTGSVELKIFITLFILSTKQNKIHNVSATPNKVSNFVG